MRPTLRHHLVIACVLLASPALAQVTLYTRPAFGGRILDTDSAVQDLARHGFDDLAASVVVARDSWLLCEDAGFGGRCITLRPGRYASLKSIGFERCISSLRPVEAAIAASAPAPATEFKRRRNQRL